MAEICIFGRWVHFFSEPAESEAAPTFEALV
jgi:hypothetical protein